MTDPTRVFLGWDQPPLPRVARWLLEAHPSDLGELTVIVPGRRSGRLLLSHLVAAAERRGVVLVPPRIVTPGALPELFYRPRRPIATRRERVLAWCEALSDGGWLDPDPEAPPGADAPSANDVAARLALASDLVRCQDELGEEGLLIGDVLAGAPAALGAGGEEGRWRTFAELERAEVAVLARGGLDDPTAARLAVLEGDGPSGEGPAVVLCCLALQRGLERRFLARFASRVEALIAAPEREAALFDAWGGLELGAWRRREVTVARESLVIADRPRGQARAVARRVAAALRDDESADAAGAGGRPGVTVGLADASLSPVIVEMLADREVLVHDAVGRSLVSSAPWRLLQAVGRYAGSRAPRELTALFRHPDLERHLSPAIEAAVAAAPEPATRELRSAVRGGDWLTALDLYTSETAVESTAGRLPGDAAGAAVVAAAEAAIATSFGVAGELRPLGEWTERIRDFLVGVYAERDLHHESADPSLARSLRRLGEELRAQAEACLACGGGPRLRLIDAIELLVSEVAGEPLAAESAPGAVEIVGWLELPLDDAPRVVVAGLDEASASGALAGGLLSPPVRRSLGLQDAETLHLRDLYFLELLIASRETTLVTGRRGAQGEPLAPRRILLASATPELVDTVAAFWGESAAEAEEAEEIEGADAIPRDGGFRPILPLLEVAIPQRLPATAFRDYLACPYRFYLRHVLGLQQVRDLPRELAPGDFGRLLHAVLGAFARTAAASSDDPEAIARALDDLLASTALLQSGATPRVAVRLQLEQLRRRLRAFAIWQAEQVRAGWTIDPEWVETRVEAKLDVDGELFVVTGRVDRVDRHPTAGARLLDYKSAEQSVTPEQAHRAGKPGERRWVDLQLPLYELMLRQRGAGSRLDGVLELGFLNLGHRLNAEPLALAGWSADDLAGAQATARDVVRAIRARRFWPPGEPPSWVDGFEGLAGDAFPDRARFLSETP